MIPVKQKEKSPWLNNANQPGDCLRAAVASILHLKLEQVPHFVRRTNYKEHYNPHWFSDLRKYLRKIGYNLHYLHRPKLGCYNIGIFKLHNSELRHAVICYGGTKVFDPTTVIPKNDMTIQYYLYLEKLVY